MSNKLIQTFPNSIVKVSRVLLSESSSVIFSSHLYLSLSQPIYLAAAFSDPSPTSRDNKIDWSVQLCHMSMKKWESSVVQSLHE